MPFELAPLSLLIPVVDVGLIPNVVGVVLVPGVVPPVDGVVPGGEPIDGVVPVLLQESQNKKINIWEYKVGLVVGNET